MTRYIIIMAAAIGLLTACRSEPETPDAGSKEILQPSTHRRVDNTTAPPVTATVTVPDTPTPEATPTPVAAMQRTSPASSPPKRIVIPDIELDAPVNPMAWQNIQNDDLTVTEWDIPVNAAGYQVGSSLPGQQGNTVLAGHHNIKGRVFENLRHLDPGDSIELYTEGNKYHYAVSDKFLLWELGAPPEQRRQNARWIGPTDDERLTLVTCWPPTGNAYRLIVVAKPANLTALNKQ